MVAGKLLHLTIANQVDPGVSDVTDQIMSVGKKKRRRRAAHSSLVDFPRRSLEDLLIRKSQRIGYTLRSLGRREVVEVGKLARNEVNSHLAGDLSGGVSAHAICYNEEPAILIGVGIEVVLVAFPQSPGIGSR